ncbi:MAG: PD-(D/E)XK nuclease family protein, partial [Clostridia bacterium]|nr:PD-(D/E)XK nuclease family protein [Clostridia bacterium]
AGSGRVRREVRFSVSLPANAVYAEGGAALAGERVLVQGSIDLLWEGEEGFVLVEFKTGGEQSDGPLRASYTRQVHFYVRAVEQIFRRPVLEAYLVFLARGEVVRVVPEGSGGGEPAGENP